MNSEQWRDAVPYLIQKAYVLGWDRGWDEGFEEARSQNDD